MKVIEINKNWRIDKSGAFGFNFEIPPETDVINLPYDDLVNTAHNFLLPAGKYNGYYDTKTINLYKELPKFNKHKRVILDIHGVSGICEIFLNGCAVKTLIYPVRTLVDLTEYISLFGANILRLAICSYADSGKYTGLGVAGGAKLIIIDSPLYIEPYGVFVKTEKLDSKAHLNIKTEITNTEKETRQFTLAAEIYNEKNKRVVKKLKKVKIAAGATKVFELPAKVGRPYAWNTYDPYVYSCKVSILEGDGGKELDSTSQSFGLTVASVENRSLKVNNSSLKLKGVVVMHDNGILGNVSELSVEKIKLARIKELGFNAVRYIGCPSDSVLEALDSLGLYCVVDIFGVMSKSKFLNDGHLFFNSSFEEVVEMSVKSLRNHPSVIMYSLADDAEESYSRFNGIETAKKVVDVIKVYDKSRLLTANAYERVPTRTEIEKYELKIPKGIADEVEYNKKAISAAREKDLFRQCTDKYFALVDIAGYSYLHPRFSTDRNINGRIILNLATTKDKAFDAAEETDKHPGVIGDFVMAAVDFIGQAKNNESDKTIKGVPSISPIGILDKTLRRKDCSYYNEIILGKKNTAYIVVQDPEVLETEGENAEVTEQNSSHLWNWPRHIGKPVKIKVYTSGDIVSLTLDGRAVGRKLAGKFNKYCAEFKTNFYPGALEAVSYYKGVEQSRVRLESVTSPKLIKLDCFSKVIKDGDLCYVDILVTDKEGRLVPFAMRNISVFVSGEGELVALNNGDPTHFINPSAEECPAYNGVVTAVVRGKGEGKIIVKAVSEGLLSNKATIKVK